MLEDIIIRMCSEYDHLQEQWQSIACAKGSDSKEAKDLYSRTDTLRDQIKAQVRSEMESVKTNPNNWRTTTSLTYFNSWLLMRSGWGSFGSFMGMSSL